MHRFIETFLNSVTAPKFNWPNKSSVQTTETIKTTYSTGGPGGTISNTFTTNYSSNTYKDGQKIQSVTNNFDNLNMNDQILKPKIPPVTLPKPNLNNWQNQGLNKITTTQQFKQQQSTIPAPGQSSFTGSKPAPRRGRGQLKNQETGRIPICANLGCCQQIRFVQNFSLDSIQEI